MSLKSLDLYVDYLAEQHAQDQEMIAAQLVLALSPIWNLIQFNELDSSTIIWLTAAIPLIRTAFMQSQRVSAAFIQNVRFASLPLDEPLGIAALDVTAPDIPTISFEMPSPGSVDVYEPLPEAKLGKSLVIETNAKIKQQMVTKNDRPDELMSAAKSRAEGTAIKYAMDGGRDVSDMIIKRDRRKVLGFARVTDLNPCYFCALLASRGPVFSKDSFKASNQKFAAHPDAPSDLPPGFSNIAKVHNNCRCTMRAIYSKSQGWDAAAVYYRQAWKDIRKNSSNKFSKDDVPVFRQWLKENPFEGSQFDLHAIRMELQDRESSLVEAGFGDGSPQVVWVRRHLQAIA